MEYKEDCMSCIYLNTNGTCGNSRSIMFCVATNADEHQNSYTWFKEAYGIDLESILQDLPFTIACAIKYILRAGHKKDASLTDKEKQVEDLNKAIWYIQDEIKRITEFNNKTKSNGKFE